ncbi:MAG TPA: SpoIIE family protein phosphatase [Trebonia sp.]|jgi:serine phosphatase RsbU (regulator of sigma subunit)|nr:SpoIIE family protein phosphatase [Trebonia sp.]
MATDAVLGTAAPTARAGQLRVLLVEDDEGDAVLVQELLNEAGAGIAVDWVTSLTDARRLVPAASCVLLDLGLPDSHGLQGVRWLLRHYPEAAVVVLTGMADEHLGEEAVRAGAQDYLVKGEVSGQMLNRVIRYAMERRRWDEARRQLHTAQIDARENARLEHGLLPQPVVADPRLTVSARCWAGGKRRLLGGDFYDTLQAPDGWVHALIGDVCGHGPAEAALGVCLRVAWRALVLAGRPADETLSTVQQVLGHEQQEDAMFATACMMSVAPGRRTGIMRLAGHPAPLLVTRDGITELTAPACPPLGLNAEGRWPACPVELGDHWSLLMYTDGLIEGRISQGPYRLGTEGLIDLVRDAMGPLPHDPGRLAGDMVLWRLMEQVRKLNNGDLNDDIAVLALSYS